MDSADDGSKPEQQPLQIPWQELSTQALRGVIEAYVLREGTEYGARDYSLEEKVTMVHAQLERGEAQLLYYARPPSVELVLKQQISQRKKDTDSG